MDLRDTKGAQLLEKHCDLGITIDSNLTFSTHYAGICAKAYRMFFFVRRCIFTTHTPLNLKRSLFLTLIQSNLTYCSQIWRPGFIRDIKSLEQIQKRITKCIIANQSLDYKSRLAKLAILPLVYFYESQDLLFLVKCLLDPDDRMNIRSFVSFSTSSRSSRSGKLSGSV